MTGKCNVDLSSLSNFSRPDVTVHISPCSCKQIATNSTYYVQLPPRSRKWLEVGRSLIRRFELNGNNCQLHPCICNYQIFSFRVSKLLTEDLGTKTQKGSSFTRCDNNASVVISVFKMGAERGRFVTGWNKK